LPSAKTPIIEYLFDLHWDEEEGSLRKSMMTLSDVQDAIRHFREHHGATLSDKNPANFMKDIVRGQNASSVWPVSLTDKHFTAIQATGDGNVFEFVRFVEGQTEPFPDKYKSRSDLRTHSISSVSVPLFARDLGREDESWLIQTAVKLGVIETHFGVYSPLNVIQLTHLQMSVKLRATEIDALFLAICRDNDVERRVLITCEAKQARERILEQQIIEQITAAFDAVSEVDFIVPVGLRAIRGKGFYLVEFTEIQRATFNRSKPLAAENEVIYELKPPLKGI
jgi:hypothetical protein